MANGMYVNAKTRLLRGQLDWESAAIKVALISKAAYTPNFSSDTVLSDVPAAARVAVSGPLTGKTVVNGACGADNVLFASVSGAQVDGILLFEDTGDEATSHLLAFIDSGYGGLPMTPNGGDIRVIWPASPTLIFSL